MRGTAKASGRWVFSVNEARGSVLTKGSRNDRDRKSEKEKEGKKSRKKRKEDRDIIGISSFYLPRGAILSNILPKHFDLHQ
jgi:hypothetical protein